MEGPAFLPLPQGLRITEIHQEETELTVEVRSERTSACCPLCECRIAASLPHAHRVLCAPHSSGGQPLRQQGSRVGSASLRVPGFYC